MSLAGRAPASKDEAVIDTLASYGVDAHQLVDVSSLPSLDEPTSSNSDAFAVCTSYFHFLSPNLFKLPDLRSLQNDI